jgi:hypothetical protein
MALPFVQVVYKVPAKAVTPATIQAALAAVALPIATVEELGSYVVSDVNANAAGFATRTIVLRINAPTPSTATAVLDPGQSGSPLRSISHTHGLGYVRPPIYWIGDAPTQTLPEWLVTQGRGARLQSYLGVFPGGEGPHATLITAGIGYSALTTAALIGGMPLGLSSDTQAKPDEFLGTTPTSTRLKDPTSNGALNTLGVVASVAMLNQGKNYAASTKAVPLDSVPVAGGRLPRGFPVIVGGKIVAVVLTDSGMGLITVPKWAFLDPTGAGKDAEASTSMMRGKPATLSVARAGNGSITAINVVEGGDGYVSVPSLVIFDPTGAGAGASATVGPVVNGAASLLGVSRIDVLNRGSGFSAPPALNERSFFEASYLVAQSQGNVTEPLRPFLNLMKSTIQRTLSAEVTEVVS